MGGRRNAAPTVHWRVRVPASERLQAALSRDIHYDLAVHGGSEEDVRRYERQVLRLRRRGLIRNGERMSFRLGGKGRRVEARRGAP